jgi:serine/threonine-protein kinase
VAVSTRAPVPIAYGTGSTDTEEGRAFFQSRLALFGGWVCLVSIAFYVVGASLRWLAGLPTTSAGLRIHEFTIAVTGALYLGGRFLRLSAAAVRAADAFVTVLIGACMAALALVFTDPAAPFRVDPNHALFISLMAGSFVLTARAVAVPSSPWRTAWVSAAAMLPLVLVAFRIFEMHTTLTMPRVAAYADIIDWAIAAVAMAVVASRVIFGLRAEVNKIKRLGQYTLEHKIGQGGMGAVYRARHALLRRPTAVKLLPPETAGEANIRRFEREVQLTAQLSHPSTIAIFDYGRTPNGVFYYAMEYLDGVDLQRLVQDDGAQPAGRVIHILRQVCGALREAHGVGLIHRDIKPANIILCERGGMPDVAKVVDFGLVKRFEAGSGEQTMAQTGVYTVLGTPLYLAPEAFAGDWAVDARCDLYAVGAVGYFLLTGEPVFSGRTVVDIGAQHLHTPPEPPSKRARYPVPADLERLLLQCLAKSPADRPPDAASLLDLLDASGRVTPWSTERAAGWWKVFRQQHPAVVAEDLPEAIRATAVIDLAGRP